MCVLCVCAYVHACVCLCVGVRVLCLFVRSLISRHNFAKFGLIITKHYMEIPGYDICIVQKYHRYNVKAESIMWWKVKIEFNKNVKTYNLHNSWTKYRKNFCLVQNIFKIKVNKNCIWHIRYDQKFLTSWRTFWRHNILSIYFDITTYYLTSCRSFCRHDVIPYYLMSWYTFHTVWPFDVMR